MAERHNELLEILTRAGMPVLVGHFTEEKLEAKHIIALSDDEMKRLGVTTIGDRLRLRESAKQQMTVNSDQTTSTGMSNSLFPGFRHFTTSRSSSRKSAKKMHEYGWTAQFYCLSSVHQQTTPTSNEKEILIRTGLGLKKIKLKNSCSEDEVFQLVKDQFPKLEDSGGFEFLRTQQNGRNLVLISPPWSSKELKCKIGPQARIYIRPIQHTLTTDPLNEEITAPSREIACDKCKKEFKLQELRNHVEQCLEHAELNDDLPDASSFFNSSRPRNVIVEGERFYQHSIPSTESSVPIMTEPDNIQSFQNPTYIQVPIEEVPAQDSDISFLNNQGNELYSVNFASHEVLPELNNEINFQDIIHEEMPKGLNDIVKECIVFCKQYNISNPVEILRKIQQEIVTGRPLEVEDLESTIEGETNYITVDRNNILQTSMEEISAVPEPELRNTLEVQFYNEQAADYGGPRKEFFRLVFFEIKEKYFDSGWRDLLADEYKTVGKILALSILQNGKLPTFFSPAVVEEVFDDKAEQGSPAMKKLREGLNTVGIIMIYSMLFQS